MKNKFVRILSLGLICFMFTTLISSYIPKHNTVSLVSSETEEKVITPDIDDPPFI